MKLITTTVGLLFTLALNAQPLLTKLGSASAEVRAKAARQLINEKKDQKAEVQALSKLLQDKYPFVQDAAVVALASYGPKAKKASKQIEKLALKGSHHWLRSNAAYALGQIKNKRSIRTLTKALKDKHFLVRQAAANALGNFGKKGKRAVRPLMRSLKDKNPWVKRNAIMALTNMKAKKAARAIKKLEKDKEVGGVAKYATKQLQGKKRKRKGK